MTFIEVHINEDKSALGKLIMDAYTATYRQIPPSPPSVGFGRVIVWENRIFQELKLRKGPDSFTHEERIFRSRNLPDDRARMQVGSIRGEVFTTPPDTGDELAARIKEGGRCGKEYVVRQFSCSDYHAEA